MKTYSFKVNGKRFETQAESRLDAFVLANQHYGYLPQGIWMETNGSATDFRWAEGNFFD